LIPISAFFSHLLSPTTCRHEFAPLKLIGD
jgi:hypothetical protein